MLFQGKHIRIYETERGKYNRGCSGKENEKLWDEVYEYIANHYDLSRVKKIYVSGDGGGWIKAGMKRISGMTYVLDEFHLEKYLTKLTSHMLDSRDDVKDELRKIIRRKSKAVRRHIVGGANRILISVLLPPRLCSTGTCRRLSAE